MGVFSFGAVAMGIVNLSVVGMGIISAGVTTMGIWEYSPNSHKNHQNHSKQISNPNKENMMSDLFNTKLEAEKAAPKYGCIGAHKMGNKWMPCKMHLIFS
jgi:anionic cell wall polymer biosynthesis LytR-Cps2A-Psr (LCP) family protein